MAANRHRAYSRRSADKTRDARLFVIATEDTNAPKQYFKIFEMMSSRVKIVVCETTDNRSSPRHVIDRLVEHRRNEDLNEDDQLWALLDTDHWIEPNHVAGLNEARSIAKQNGIRIAMSNPCFDLWLLLHHMDLPCGHGIRDANGVAEYMRRNGFQFNKQRLNVVDYTPAAVRMAIERSARMMAADTGSGWPQSVGTQMHLLLEELRAAGILLV
jgi:hypothetical protein